MYYKHKTPAWIQKIYPSLTWHRRPSENEIYLTFDDGPIPGLTPEILKILDSFNAKATFFCVGDNVRKHPEIYNQVLSGGHAVGNHTMHHIDGWKHPDEVYFEDVEMCRESMESQGHGSRLFRPPYGKIRRKQLRKIRDEYEIIMWDVLSGDFDQALSPEECYQNTIAHTVPGSIVVFHDNLKASARVLYALPRFLEEMNKRNWKCMPLE